MGKGIDIGQLVEVTLDTMSAIDHRAPPHAHRLGTVQDGWLRTRAGERGLVVAESNASRRRVQVLIDGVPREIRKSDLRLLEDVK